MRHAVLFAVALSMLAVCPGVRAEDEPKLTIAFDHAKLTTWVLEDFPGGLPFDRTGAPTDAKKAQEFWQLIADWPISVGGEITDLRAALERISDETGLPLLYGKDALAKIEAAEKKMRMVTISDSVQKAIRIICRLAGVDKTLATPYGLVILGPDEEADLKALLTAPPKNTFRWRQNKWEKIKEEFPDGYTQDMPEEDWVRLHDAVLKTRCDLIIAKEMALCDFIAWFARSADQSIIIAPIVFQTTGAPGPAGDDGVPPDKPTEDAVDIISPDEPTDRAEDEEPADERPGNDDDSDSDDGPFVFGPELVAAGPGLATVQPLVLRFVTFRDALNAALESKNLMVGKGFPRVTIVPKDATKEELEKSRQEQVESLRSTRDSSD